MRSDRGSSLTCLASEHARHVISFEFLAACWSPIAEAQVAGAEEEGFEIWIGLPIREQSSLDLEREAEAARDRLARQHPVSALGANCLLLAMFRDLRGAGVRVDRFCQSAESLSAGMPLWSLEHGGGEATDLVPLAAWLAARLLNGDALPPAGCSSRHLQSLVDALPSADWPPEFSPIKSFRLLDQALGEGAGFLLSHHSTIAGYGLGRPDFQTDPDEPHRPFATMARLPKL